MRQLLCSMGFIFILGCGGAAGNQVESSAAEFPDNIASSSPHNGASVHGQSPHWGYSGDVGPENWGNIMPDYATCKNGKSQSPVNIVEEAVSLDSALDDLQIQFASTPLALLNNGHTLQVNVKSEGQLTAGGAVYKLKQFHFHAPSENTVNGKPFAGEMHLVHQAGDTLAVLSVVFDIGDANVALQTVLDNAAQEAGPEQVIKGLSIDPNALLPDSTDYWFWEGSLTTPPCTEGVKWYLFKQPITASQAQIDAFTSIIGPNARPTLDLNGREIKSNH